MGISVEKWLVMVSLAVISGILGFIPYFILNKIKSWRSIFNNRGYHQVLTVLSCIGAGVLLSVALGHMLPENRESLLTLEYVQLHIDQHTPLAEILALSGFVIIYLIEEIAHFILSIGDELHSGNHHHYRHSHQHGMSERDSIVRHNSLAHGIPGPIPGGPRSSFLSSANRGSFIGINVNLPTPSVPTLSSVDDGSKTKLSPNDLAENKSNLEGKLRAFLALIALSFHAIMEGIAIGIQNSSNLWLMFGAIASHKFVISFCMGMELSASEAKLKTFIGSISIFAVLSPLGIFIGSYLTSDDATKSLPVCILEGFATGTILYVVFFEILSRERERKSDALKTAKYTGFMQFISMLAGMTGMMCLLVFAGHSHSEEDHDHEHEHRNIFVSDLRI